MAFSNFHSILTAASLTALPVAAATDIHLTPTAPPVTRSGSMLLPPDTADCPRLTNLQLMLMLHQLHVSRLTLRAVVPTCPPLMLRRPEFEQLTWPASS